MMDEDRKNTLMYQATLETSRESNCRSRNIGCIITDMDGNILSEGANITGNVHCVFLGCFKRKMGATEGHSVYCDATHAEETAAKLYELICEEKDVKEFPPVVAIMNCGFPCRYCLSELHNVNVKHLILSNDLFYTKEDQLAWDDFFSGEMTYEVVKI